MQLHLKIRGHFYFVPNLRLSFFCWSTLKISLCLSLSLSLSLSYYGFWHLIWGWPIMKCRGVWKTETPKQPTENGRIVFKISVWFQFGLVSVSHFLKPKNWVLVVGIHAPNQPKPNQNKYIIYIYIYMGLANILNNLGHMFGLGLAKISQAHCPLDKLD